jgi:hypothetical protein
MGQERGGVALDILDNVSHDRRVVDRGGKLSVIDHIQGLDGQHGARVVAGIVAIAARAAVAYIRAQQVAVSVAVALNFTELGFCSFFCSIHSPKKTNETYSSSSQPASSTVPSK